MRPKEVRPFNAAFWTKNCLEETFLGRSVACTYTDFNFKPLSHERTASTFYMDERFKIKAYVLSTFFCSVKQNCGKKSVFHTTPTIFFPYKVNNIVAFYRFAFRFRLIVFGHSVLFVVQNVNWLFQLNNNRIEWVLETVRLCIWGVSVFESDASFIVDEQI